MICLCLAVGLPRTELFAQGNDSKVGYVNTNPNVAYLGDAACRPCHADIYENFKKTGMGRSIALPSLSDALGEFRHPGNIHSNKASRTFTSFVSNGKFFHREVQKDPTGKLVFSDTHQVAYSVGSGDHGRSYLISRGDFLFMSPLSYYSLTRKWDLSPGYTEGLYEGFSRPVPELCVYCHSELPQPIPGTLNRYKNPPFRFLAIGCERCHGPGELHVQQRTRSDSLAGSYDPSIVNPAKLSVGLRDNVCEQCHLAGDARVLRPEKSYTDYRPGTSLDDVVAIFSVPLRLKSGASEAISQDIQMKLSRCRIESHGKLGCITCHDPHFQPRESQAASYFVQKCLKCHTIKSCNLNMKTRLATSPPDNCVGCHMPKKELATISHAALTDHRILRRPSQEIQSLVSAKPGSDPPDLVNETGGVGTPGGPDMRTKALAYAQVAENFPLYVQSARILLELAAKQFPDDPEVQTTYGLGLLKENQSTASQILATQTLEKAIKLHSTSADARTRLAELKFQGGYINAAITLLEEAIKLEPYHTPAHLALARIYLALGDRRKAIEGLQRLLSFDPGNEEARKDLKEARVSSRP